MATFQEVPIEKVQRYWDARPCNIRHSLEPLGSRAYFDEVEARKYTVEPHIPHFAEFDRWRGKRVLEIGCGIGTDTINFARAGAEVTAVDLSPKSLEMTGRRAEVYRLANRIKLFAANAEELSKTVPVDAYDLVYSFGVVHHTPHPERVLTELRRYLKPGGVLKVMLYYRRSWKVMSIVLGYGKGRFWRLNELVAAHSEAQLGCPVTYTYNRQEACRLVEAHDFRVVEIAVDHIFPYRISDYVEYRYVKEWYFRWMPRWAFKALEHRLGWHLMITAEAV